MFPLADRYGPLIMLYGPYTNSSLTCLPYGMKKWREYKKTQYWENTRGHKTGKIQGDTTGKIQEDNTVEIQEDTILGKYKRTDIRKGWTKDNSD